MLSYINIAQLACIAAIATVASVDAHGYMSAPKPTFAISGDTTQFCATMDGSSTLTAPAGESFDGEPASNAKAFNEALKASSYASVRALVDAKAVFISDANKECGLTSATGAKQPLPDKYVEWSHSATEGFTPSHQGPCEVWCDSTLAFQDDNCAANYPTVPAKLPYDKSKCAGASLLKFYWLALHSSTWQVYINCAPLEGGSSGGGASTPVMPSVLASTPTTNATATNATSMNATSSTLANTTSESVYPN